MTTSSGIKRGDVWEVRFDPSEGDEIKKIRPAVVIDVAEAGRMNLRIVVPLTGWQPSFEAYIWMVKIIPVTTNGLRKVSAADAFQVKSVSDGRFGKKLGQLTEEEVNLIATAIAYVVGYRP